MKLKLIIGAIIITLVIWLGRKHLRYVGNFIYAVFLPETWDPQTDAHIAELHPLIRNRVTQFINQAEKRFDIQLRIISGLRDCALQNSLYAQGRTKPGNIVTNAKCGDSYHNFGLAIDVQPTKPLTNEQWQQLASLGEQYGLSWGGYFKGLVDKPHFQYSKETVQQLAEKLNAGYEKDGYVILT